MSLSSSEIFLFFFHKVEYWTCSSSYFCQFLCLIFLSQQVFTKRMPTVCGERYRSKKFSKQFVLPVLYIRSGPSVSSFCGISSFRNVCGEFSVKAVVSPCHINFQPPPGVLPTSQSWKTSKMSKTFQLMLFSRLRLRMPPLSY